MARRGAEEQHPAGTFGTPRSAVCLGEVIDLFHFKAQIVE